ncbi:MAG: 4Fe-4S dicluster domain-containing protein [Rhodanobacteraceae bacterium]|nr:MAG: 4Fe-4S dicluster domain-containing protein [Rhodanobacteraceae bacterium]
MTSLPAPAKKKLGLVIDLDTCVGCHACAIACKEWNDGGAFGPLADDDPYGADPHGVWFNRVHSYEVQPPAHANAPREVTLDSLMGTAPPDAAGTDMPAPQMVHFPRSCLHCETPDCVTVCPTGASYKRAEDGIVLVDEDKCIGCQLCAWACPYGAREIALPHPKTPASDTGRTDQKRGTMQKCTLCVDRIYNETLDACDRQPACVLACPTHARLFGDLGDPDSNVSKVVAERGGFALMPEFGYQPVNRYLPPRPRRDGSTIAATPTQPAPRAETLDTEKLPPLLRWLDKALSR